MMDPFDIEEKINSLSKESGEAEILESGILEAVAALKPLRQNAMLELLAGHLGYDTVRTRDRFLVALRKEIKLILKERGEDDEASGSPVSKRLVHPDLVDVVEHEGELRFLMYRGNDALLSDEIVLEDGTMMTVPRREEVLWTPPRYDEVMEAATRPDPDSHLFNELLSFLRRVSELPSVEHYPVLAAWVLHTYLVDRFEYSPIMWFHSPPARGKSRTMKGLLRVAYRGILIHGVREAAIMRLSDYFSCSMGIDVMDLEKVLQKDDTQDLINSRFENGYQAFRVMNPGEGRFDGMTAFSIFGPTLLGTNSELPAITATRCLRISMRSSEQVFKSDISQEACLPLRAACTAFRLRHLKSDVPEGDCSLQGRVRDACEPLIRTLSLAGQDDEISSVIKVFFEEQDHRRELKSGSPYVAVLRALLALGGSGFIPTSDVARKMNESLRSGRIEVPTVGTMLSYLGFTKKKQGQVRGFIIEPSLIHRLCAEYDVCD